MIKQLYAFQGQSRCHVACMPMVPKVPSRARSGADEDYQSCMSSLVARQVGLGLSRAGHGHAGIGDHLRVQPKRAG